MAEPEFVTLQVEDGVGTIRLDRPKMNAIDEQLHLRGARRGDGGREARRRPRRRPLRRRAGLRRRRRHQGDVAARRHGHGRLGPRAAPTPSPHVARDPQAGHRRGHRLRARRRLRAGAVRRLPGARRLGEDRPARDPARRHPRRRRHAAAGPAGRAGEGQGPRSSPAGTSAPRRRWRSAWPTPSSRTTRSTRPRWRWRGSSPPVRRWRWPPPSGRSTRAWTLPLREGLALESRLFAELFDTEDQKTGMRSFLENGPGKAQFTGR